jgi:LysM repeat protein
VSYTVKTGDTLWGIATKARTTIDAIAAANHLAKDAVIVPGQVLLVPASTLPRVPERRPRPPVAPVAVHVVKAGETVTSIAAKYHVAVADVLRANKLTADSIIRPGQKLLLPGVAAKQPQRAPAPVTHPYVVKRGDTLSGIALAAHVPLTSVTALNHLSAADVIFPGQRLLLPGPAPAAPTTPKAAAATAAGAIAGQNLRTPVRQAADANRAAVAVRPAPDAGEVEGLVRGTAQRFGVDPALAVAVAVQESGLNQQKVSSANAIGVMQVVPSSGRWASTLVGRDLNLLDTRDNVVAGVAILSSLTSSTSEETAVAAYYQGLGSVRAHGMFADTRRYVADVLALRRRFS